MDCLCECNKNINISKIITQIKLSVKMAVRSLLADQQGHSRCTITKCNKIATDCAGGGGIFGKAKRHQYLLIFQVFKCRAVWTHFAGRHGADGGRVAMPHDKCCVVWTRLYKRFLF